MTLWKWGAVSLELLTGKDSDPTASADVNVALVPLSTSLLAGPGAIVATIIFVRRIEKVTLVVPIAGLLLSAIAVQMIADAVRAFIKVG